jgi:hypothetical protein
MCVTCLLKLKLLSLLSIAQVAPQTNYKVETTQNKHTIHSSKRQPNKQKRRVGYSICFVFVALRVLGFGDVGMRFGLQGWLLINVNYHSSGISRSWGIMNYSNITFEI